MKHHEELIRRFRSADVAGMKPLLRSDPNAAQSPRLVIEAGRLASIKALKLLLEYGADLNATYRGYRAVHALIQEKPHATERNSPAERTACLRWLLAKGADPELLGAFPPMRALQTAAFVGEPAYIDTIREAGAVVDGFTAAALGELRRVGQTLKKEELTRQRLCHRPFGGRVSSLPNSR